MKYTWLYFLDYNLVKNYKALFPKLQSKKKKKKKDNTLSTNQNLDSGTRLQNRKVLDTNFSGLLDSK